MKRVHVMNPVTGDIENTYIREEVQTSPRFYVQPDGSMFYGYTFHGQPTAPVQHLETWGQFLKLSNNA